MSQIRTIISPIDLAGLTQLVDHLRDGGALLLPSDTCYSLCVVPSDQSVREYVNDVLDRHERWPLSLAFADEIQLKEHVHMGMVARAFVEEFTPGPVTMIMDARDVQFAQDALGAPDGTIGARVPDSIEREVATVLGSPVTTTAIRDETGLEVRQLDHAVARVTARLRFAASRNLIAVRPPETGFLARHSTVVRISSEGEDLRVIREGQLSIDDFRKRLHKMLGL